MKKLMYLFTLIVIFFLLSDCSSKEEQKTATDVSTIDLNEARKVIESIDAKFAEDFNKGDSLALAGYYAKDGRLGSVRGRENLVSALGKIIRNALKNGTPHIKYTTTSLSSDGEFLVETGIYQSSDNEGNVKGNGKYLVVWKQKDGLWKIYRDIGL
jgi:ketosteroid isomerase-like protein